MKNQNKKKLLVFTATYNEKDNIEQLIGSIHSALEYADLVVIDDNSPDGTGKLLDLLAQKKKYLKVLHRPGKLGLGTAHQLAMLYAIKNNYDHLVTMDADHSHDPADLPNLVKPLDQFDFVIGSRYMPGGKCDYEGYRKIISTTANLLARILLNIKLHEFTTSFRAINVANLVKINFIKIQNHGYSFFMESLYRFHQTGFRMTEIPITFKDRNSGVSKIPRFEIFRGVLKLMQLTISRILHRKMPPPPPLETKPCQMCRSPYTIKAYSPITRKNWKNILPYFLQYLNGLFKEDQNYIFCLQCGYSLRVKK